MAKLYYDQVPFDSDYDISLNNFTLGGINTSPLIGGNTGSFLAKVREGMATQAETPKSFLDTLKDVFAVNPDDPTRTKAEVTTQASGTLLGDLFEDYFIRAAVIILGFIFVAAGLSMFKVTAPVVNVVKNAVP